MYLKVIYLLLHLKHYVKIKECLVKMMELINMVLLIEILSYLSYDTHIFDKVAENTEFKNTAVDSFNQGKLKYAFNDYDSRVARGEIEPNPAPREPMSRRAIKTVRGWMGLE